MLFGYQIKIVGIEIRSRHTHLGSKLLIFAQQLRRELLKNRLGDGVLHAKYVIELAIVGG